MCLLIFKPAGQSIPFEYLENADYANPHGAGIAFADGTQTKILKGAKWHAEDIAEKLEKLEENPAIIHFRFATHGSEVDKNTHPFYLPKKWAAAHNGVISDVECLDDESDTRAFLRTNVKPVIRYGGCLSERKTLDLIGTTVGTYNKLVFLHGSGKYGIANEDSGHWKDGVWYSNYSYAPEPTYYGKNYGGYQAMTHQPSFFKGVLDSKGNVAKSKYSNFTRFNAYTLECAYCNRDILGEFYVNNTGQDIICPDCEENYTLF